MIRTRSLIALGGVAAIVAPGAAMGDGGGTSWASSASLAGAWTGTAASTAVAGLTFPVSATVAVSATGRPSGVSMLGDPVNCAGTWTPVSTARRTTMFSERIAGGAAGRCIDDGTVRLSPASGGRLRYVWTKRDAGSVAYLDPVGISGGWAGTLRQPGTPPVAVRLRVVGVRAGQMAGASRYGPPFSCAGRLQPLRGTQRRAVLVERITRSASSDCVGTGVMTLSLRADGRLAYRWQGGGEESTALLSRMR